MNYIYYQLSKLTTSHKKDLLELISFLKKNNIDIIKKTKNKILLSEFLKLLLIVYKYILIIDNYTFNPPLHVRKFLTLINTNVFIKNINILEYLSSNFIPEYLFNYSLNTQTLIRLDILHDYLYYKNFISDFLNKPLKLELSNIVIKIGFTKKELIKKNIYSSGIELNIQTKNGTFLGKFIIGKDNIIIDHLQLKQLKIAKSNLEKSFYPKNSFYHITILIGSILAKKYKKKYIKIFKNYYHPFYHHKNFFGLYDQYGKKYHFIDNGNFWEITYEELVNSIIFKNKYIQYNDIIKHLNKII